MSLTGQASEGVRPSDALREAVHRFKAASFDGIRERIFTLAFKGLVYPQIWEDPEVDLRALELKPGASMIAIASGRLLTASCVVRWVRTSLARSVRRSW